MRTSDFYSGDLVDLPKLNPIIFLICKSDSDSIFNSNYKSNILNGMAFPIFIPIDSNGHSFPFMLGLSEDEAIRETPLAHPGHLNKGC